MSLSPIFRVYVGPKRVDISAKIEKLKHEHNTKKDNSLELYVRRDFSEAMADDPDIITGYDVTFQYGFLQGQMGPVYVMKISDIEVKYADRITMMIRCLDEGNDMKKNSPQVIWKGKNAAQIAREIAKAHKLKADVFEGSDLRKITEEAQGNKSDFEFLRYLASKEAGYIFFVDQKGLHFKKRVTKGQAAAHYTYGDGRIIEFNPKLRKSTQKGDSQSADIMMIDPMTKKESKVNDNSGVKLGKNKYDLNANFIGRDEGSAKKNVVTPSTNTGDAAAASNALNSAANMGVLEASFKVLGNPLLQADTILTLSGVARKYLGNWYIEKVINEVSTSGFLTSGELGKDGTAAPIKPGVGENKDVNKTVGPKDQTGKNKVHRYDQNSNPYTGPKNNHGSGGTF